MRSVYVVDHDVAIVKMFHHHPFYQVVDDFTNSDIVVFPGGPDVDPSLYDDVCHPTTRFDPRRDALFQSVLNGADANALLVGICGGGQFLNIINGGTMWQNVDNHAIYGTHPLTYRCENGADAIVNVTSTHHQMMCPKGLYELWGTAMRTTFRDRGADRNKPTDYNEDGLDIEIVFYPETGSLCFQPHPEYGVESCRELFFECLERAFKG